MKRMRSGTRWNAIGAALVVWVLVAAPEVGAQGTGYFFDSPAAYVSAGPNLAHDLSSSRKPPGPRHAALAITNEQNGGGETKVDAVATLSGRRGFGAFAYVRSPSARQLGYAGRAQAAMMFLAQDPENRDRVRVDIEYQAVADTGFAFLESPGNPVEFPAVTSFDLAIGRLGNHGQYLEDEWGNVVIQMPTVGGPVAPILEVSGIHIRNDGDPAPGFHELVLRSHGQELQRKTGRGALEYKQKITVDVPVNYVQLMTLDVDAVTNGVAYLDPVVTANADNPNVVVTVFGSLDPNPSPVVLSREELVEVGIDPGPLESIGIVVPDPDPSASPVASPSAGASVTPGPSGAPTDAPTPAPTPPSPIAFVVPAPGTAQTIGRSLRARFRVVDAGGAPIADAEAKALATRCRVRAGLDAATVCARYDKRRDLFTASIRVPRKTTSPGSHEVVVRMLDAAGMPVVEAATPIAVVPRARR